MLPLVAGKSFRARCLTLVLCLIPLGCGSSAPAKGKLYPVNGSVFCEGEPAFGASIVFQPIITDEKLMKASGKDRYLCPPAYATVGADGSYKLMSFDPGDGARAGNYGVTITWLEEFLLDDQPAFGPDKLGGQYSTLPASQITFEVKPGKNEVPRIDVKLPKVKK